MLYNALFLKQKSETTKQIKLLKKIFKKLQQKD